MALLAIDIGGTFIKYATITTDNQVSHEGKRPTPDNLTDFWTSLEEIVHSSEESLEGIAISCPGEIATKTGYVYRGGLIPYLVNIPLARELQERTGLAVSVLNDADAAALAEARLGRLQNANCGAALVLGTGVGLGLVTNGNLLSFRTLVQTLRKPRFQATATEQESYQWKILKKGINNLLANTGSAVGFVHQASGLLGLAQDDGFEVFNVIKTGKNQDLNHLFEQYCHDIAVLIYNLQRFFVLDTIAIGGGISAEKILIEAIDKQYRLLLENNTDIDVQPIPILACSFHNQSNLLGAVAHFRNLTS